MGKVIYINQPERPIISVYSPAENYLKRLERRRIRCLRIAQYMFIVAVFGFFLWALVCGPWNFG